jgi:hypothetical protein
MSPNSPEGKEAYERLIQLGFVETKYKGWLKFYYDYENRSY